jgi:hypothetical protein
MTNMISIDSHGTAMQVELFNPQIAPNGGAIIAALILHYFEKTRTVGGYTCFRNFRLACPFGRSP